jgi:hypothetical protein
MGVSGSVGLGRNRSKNVHFIYRPGHHRSCWSGSHALRTTAPEMPTCTHSGDTFIHRRFCKTIRGVRQLGRTGSYELSLGNPQAKNTDSQSLCVCLSPQKPPLLFLILSEFPYLFLCHHLPCSLSAPARSYSLQVASQLLYTQELIHLHHSPHHEWQAGERGRLQKNRLSSLLTGSLLTERTQPVILPI